MATVTPSKDHAAYYPGVRRSRPSHSLSYPVYLPVVQTTGNRAQELCESGVGRPGLPSLISRVVSVDVKHHVYLLASVGHDRWRRWMESR